jgi:hypothetical protein
MAIPLLSFSNFYTGITIQILQMPMLIVVLCLYKLFCLLNICPQWSSGESTGVQSWWSEFKSHETL